MTKVWCDKSSCIYQHIEGYCIKEVISLLLWDENLEYGVVQCDDYRAD